MQKIKQAYNDITEARRFIFETMKKVSNQKITIEEAKILHKLSTNLMEGYRIHQKAIECEIKYTLDSKKLLG